MVDYLIYLLEKKDDLFQLNMVLFLINVITLFGCYKFFYSEKDLLVKKIKKHSKEYGNYTFYHAVNKNEFYLKRKEFKEIKKTMSLISESSDEKMDISHFEFFSKNNIKKENLEINLREVKNSFLTKKSANERELIGVGTFLLIYFLLANIKPFNFLAQLELIIMVVVYGLSALILSFIILYGIFNGLKDFIEKINNKVSELYIEENKLIQCQNNLCLIDSREHQWENGKCPHCRKEAEKKYLNHVGYDIITSPVKSKIKLIKEYSINKLNKYISMENKKDKLAIEILEKLQKEKNKKEIKKIKKLLNKGVEMEYFLNQVELKSKQLEQSLDQIHINSLENSINFEKEKNI